MINDAFSILEQAISGVLGIFTQLADSFGVAGILLGFFTIFTIVRLLLAPIIGGSFKAGKSDTVKSKKEE